MKSSITSSGSKWYAYILVYVDNILITDEDPSKHMNTLRENYNVKPSSIGEPKLYLGDDVNKVFYPDGLYSWAMGSNSYTKAEKNDVKYFLEDHNLCFNKKLSDIHYTPIHPFLKQDHRSESDDSNECNDLITTY